MEHLMLIVLATLIAIAGAKVHTPEFRDNGQQMRIALNCAFPTETDLSKVKLLEDYSKEEAIKACVDKCLKEEKAGKCTHFHLIYSSSVYNRGSCYTLNGDIKEEDAVYHQQSKTTNICGIIAKGNDSDDVAARTAEDVTGETTPKPTTATSAAVKQGLNLLMQALFFLIFIQLSSTLCVTCQPIKS